MLPSVLTAAGSGVRKRPWVVRIRKGRNGEGWLLLVSQHDRAGGDYAAKRIEVRMPVRVAVVVGPGGNGQGKGSQNDGRDMPDF